MSSAVRNKNSFSEVFTFVNTVKIVGTFLVATCAIWLNNTYVRQEQFTVLDARVQNVEYRTSGLEKQLADIAPSIKNIESRLGNFITENGKIIYSDRLIAIEKDVSLIQKDIEYMKDNMPKKSQP